MDVVWLVCRGPAPPLDRSGRLVQHAPRESAELKEEAPLRVPAWLPLTAAAVVMVGGFLAAEPKTPLTWAWLFWVVAFFAIEAYAIYNGTPGDTLSGYIWRWARAAWWRKLVVAAALAWLAYHFVLQPLMPY